MTPQIDMNGVNNATLAVVYITLFILIVAFGSLASRSIIGFAWSFLAAALISMLVVGALYMGCAQEYDWNSWSTNSMWCLAVLLIIIGIILVIVAYAVTHHRKKKLIKSEADKLAAVHAEEHHHNHSMHRAIEQMGVQPGMVPSGIESISVNRKEKLKITQKDGAQIVFDNQSHSPSTPSARLVVPQSTARSPDRRSAMAMI